MKGLGTLVFRASEFVFDPFALLQFSRALAYQFFQFPLTLLHALDAQAICAHPDEGCSEHADAQKPVRLIKMGLYVDFGERARVIPNAVVVAGLHMEPVASRF